MLSVITSAVGKGAGGYVGALDYVWKIKSTRQLYINIEVTLMHDIKIL